MLYPQGIPLPSAQQPVQGGDALLPWHAAMRRGVAAAHQGQLLLALVSYGQALSTVRGLLARQAGGVTPLRRAPVRADDLVAALVVSYLNLADLHADSGGIGRAAQLRAEVHQTLMRLLCDIPADEALHQAALRHSRETHAALLRHLAEHGHHPATTRALHAGCLVLSAASPTLH